MRKFIDSKPDTFKQIQKKYTQNAIDQVTNRYCTRLLRNHYSLEYIKLHPELILETRERIQQKRKVKNNSVLTT